MRICSSWRHAHETPRSPRRCKRADVRRWPQATPPLCMHRPERAPASRGPRTVQNQAAACSLAPSCARQGRRPLSPPGRKSQRLHPGSQPPAGPTRPSCSSCGLYLQRGRWGGVGVGRGWGWGGVNVEPFLGWIDHAPRACTTCFKLKLSTHSNARQRQPHLSGRSAPWTAGAACHRCRWQHRAAARSPLGR